MTQNERDAVVELLRKAARLSAHPKHVGAAPLFDAADAMGYGEISGDNMHPVLDVACRAIEKTGMPCSADQLSLAAQRVEEGSWP